MTPTMEGMGLGGRPFGRPDSNPLRQAPASDPYSQFLQIMNQKGTQPSGSGGGSDIGTVLMQLFGGGRLGSDDILRVLAMLFGGHMSHVG